MYLKKYLQILVFKYLQMYLNTGAKYSYPKVFEIQV